MPVENLVDSMVRVWRPTQPPTVGGLGEVIESYEVVHEPTVNNGRMRSDGGRMQDKGPGEQPVGQRKWYLTRVVSVRERDVLEVVTGPMASSRWRVEAPPDHPGANHFQCATEPFVGTLPGDEES